MRILGRGGFGALSLVLGFLGFACWVFGFEFEISFEILFLLELPTSQCVLNIVRS